VRVLIVRIGAMGDVLHALPAVAAMRERHPDWFIGWAIEPRWSDLLQIAGDEDDLSQGVGRFAGKALVDRWYSVPAGMWRQRPLARATLKEILTLRRALRAERFDVCVDLQGAMKSAVVGKMAGAGGFAGVAKPRERAARRFYKQRVEVTATHVVEQGCELLGAALGEMLRPVRVPLPMDAEDERWAAEVVGNERFCLIAPGAGWGAKVWPAERYGRVAAQLGRAGIGTVVSAPLGGPAQASVAESARGGGEAESVVAASEGFARAVPCSLGQLIALARRAAVVIAGDTGPLHLAAALERPVVGIYGPTDPRRNGPFGKRAGDRVRVLRDAASVTSHKRVGDAEAGMLLIEVEDVVRAAMEMVG
jgi:lipopolysaccharide heptosyltransferase I